MTRAAHLHAARGARPWPGVLAVLALAGCGPAPSPPSEPRPTLPAPITDGGTALVLGAVNSPIYDELKSLVKVVQYDGRQKAADHLMVVFDGDALTPAAIHDNPQINEALLAGKWVLGLDLDDAHKKGGLYHRLGATTRGTSAGFLARMAQVQGHPAVYISELAVGSARAPVGQPVSRDVRATGALPASPASPASPDATLARVRAASYAKNVIARVRAGTAEVRAAQGPTPPSNKPGLFSKQYFFDNGGGGLWRFPQASHNPRINQIGNIGYSHVFSLYLNNANNPQGDFQYVAIDTDITVNPTNGTGNWGCYGCYTIVNTADEYAWFLWDTNFSITPEQGDLLSPQGSSPATTNNEDSYTTGLSFGVNFTVSEQPGVSGGFTYSNSQTRDITDWALDNNGSGDTFAWHYRTASPWDVNNPFDGFAGTGYPEQPNAISSSQLQLHAQGAWKSSQVLTQDLSFDTSYGYHLADAWCGEDGSAILCLGKEWLQAGAGGTYGTPTFTINAASVVPIPVTSISYGNGAVVAGTPATGTITLASPAVEDSTIALKNQNGVGNVDVPDSVTVRQGETTATFVVNTNANGLAPGQSVTANINAYYGPEYQSQLVVTNVASSLTVNPPLVVAGQTANAILTLNPAPSVDTTVPLSSSGGTYAVPSNFSATVAAGQTSAPFLVYTGFQGLTAGVAGGSGSAAVATISAGSARAQLRVRFPPLSAGYDRFACATRSDGTVACWGNDDSGQSTPPAGLSGVAQVSSGNSHACALQRNGTVTCWGNNNSGQATPPGGLSGVAQVSAGNFFTCALQNGGAVTCWGANDAGELNVPAGLSNVIQIATSSVAATACAVTGSGTAACWGANGSGQANVPTGLSNVVQVSVGSVSTCALRSDGTAVCWGDSSTSAPSSSNLVALSVAGEGSAGTDTACGVGSNGAVACWGYNNRGQATPPVGLSNVVQVSSSIDYSCALKSDGTAVCWGQAPAVPTGLNLLYP